MEEATPVKSPEREVAEQLDEKIPTPKKSWPDDFDLQFPKPRKKRKVGREYEPIADENYVIIDKTWHLIQKDQLEKMVAEGAEGLKWFPKRDQRPIMWVEGKTDVPPMFPKQNEDDEEKDGMKEQGTSTSSKK